MEASLQRIEPRDEPLGLVWIDCPNPLLSTGLERLLEAHAARLHRGGEPPKQAPAAVVCYVEDEDVGPRVRRIKASAPEAPVVVLYPYVDPVRARAALEVGARGAIPVGMPPQQIVRALLVAVEGEIALPRTLLEELVTGEQAPSLSALRPRQLEILSLVAEGLSNAQVAQRLFLSESTVKQHLRGAYKALGVSNRNQAARLLLRNGPDRIVGRLPQTESWR